MTSAQHRGMPSPDRPTALRPGPAEGAPMIPTTTRAAIRHRYGAPSTVIIGQMDTPTPGPDEVLLEVHAAGLDRGVWHLVTGLPYLIRLVGYGLRRPRQPVLGADVAGRVVARGSDVTSPGIGEIVFGVGTGTFATFARARADQVVPLPAGASTIDAAAITVSGLAALQAVREIAGVRAGQRVMVLGAAGGVGSLAVQLATAAGADVTGVASGPKLDLVAQLGASTLVDYTRDDPCDGADRYDVIIDTGGRTPLGKLRRALNAEGTLVIVGGENGGRWTGGVGRQLRALALSPWVGQRLTSLFSSATPERLTELSVALAGGLTPAVEHVYRLGDVPQALDDLVGGRVRGKAVIEVLPAD